LVELVVLLGVSKRLTFVLDCYPAQRYDLETAYFGRLPEICHPLGTQIPPLLGQDYR